uniref:Uncharacterized protein n=2 Tax=Parascaris univalens TaxID=6257 RepID=A0A915BJR3_PARUN
SRGCFVRMLLLASILRGVSSHVNSVQSSQRFAMHTGDITVIACSVMMLCTNCTKKKNAVPRKRSRRHEEQTKKKFNDRRMKKQTRTYNSTADCEVRTSSADPFDVVNMELKKLSEGKKTHKKRKHHHRRHHHVKRRARSEQIDDSEPCSSPIKKERISPTFEMDRKNSERVQQKSQHFIVRSTKESREERRSNVPKAFRALGERGMHVSQNETSITYNEGMSKTFEGLKPREFVKGAKEMRIAQGQRVSKHAYKTLDDVESDWSSSARVSSRGIRHKNRARRGQSATALKMEQTTKQEASTQNADELPLDQTQKSVMVDN